jgi:hypothetical protein
VWRIVFVVGLSWVELEAGIKIGEKIGKSGCALILHSHRYCLPVKSPFIS